MNHVIEINIRLFDPQDKNRHQRYMTHMVQIIKKQLVSFKINK